MKFNSSWSANSEVLPENLFIINSEVLYLSALVGCDWDCATVNGHKVVVLLGNGWVIYPNLCGSEHPPESEANYYIALSCKKGTTLEHADFHWRNQELFAFLDRLKSTLEPQSA